MPNGDPRDGFFYPTLTLIIVLFCTGQFTVFGPTNAAFEALPDSVKVALNKDKDLLKKVLLFHVADGRTYSSQLSNNMIVQTVEHGLSIRVNIYNTVSILLFLLNNDEREPAYILPTFVNVRPCVILQSENFLVNNTCSLS